MLDYLCNIFNTQENDINENTKEHVYVNVYDMIKPNYLTNIGYYTLGVGVFHSGVEIGGKEYCFGGHDIPDMTGVFTVEPKIGIPELTLKHSYDMGTIDLTEEELEGLLIELSDEYVGPSYSLLTRNCNHFTEDFVKRLTNKSIPQWINRAAKLGNLFPCMVPWDWIQPPELIEEDEVSSRRSSTVSLLSSKRNTNTNLKSSYTFISNESQDRLL